MWEGTRGAGSVKLGWEFIIAFWFKEIGCSIASFFFMWFLDEILFSMIRLTVSTFVVSSKLLMLPCSSAVVESSGENFHSSSTINLYW